VQHAAKGAESFADSRTGLNRYEPCLAMPVKEPNVPPKINTFRSDSARIR